MLPREIEKKEELVAPRKREVEKRENSEERAVRDFQIPWFVRGFEINRFGPLKSTMDLGQIQILLILSYPNKEFEFGPPQIQIHGIQTDQMGWRTVRMLGVRPMIKYQRLQSTSIKKLLTSSHPTTECVGSHHAICHSWDEWGFAQRIHQGRGSRLKTHGASKGIFFLNNQIPQTISLVSNVSKQFSNLTNQVRGTRFCSLKSSVLHSSFIFLALSFSLRSSFFLLHFPSFFVHKFTNRDHKEESKSTKKKETTNSDQSKTTNPLLCYLNFRGRAPRLFLRWSSPLSAMF